MSNANGQGLSEDELKILAARPSPEYDEVVSQADYAARAMLSFYRFRQLGGSEVRRKPPRKRRPEAANADEAKTLRSEQNQQAETERRAKLKLGETALKGVHYVSDHPDVRLLQLSVVALLVLFESAANAYFFAQQSSFGLAGGVFQAAAVSLANVAVSFFVIGYWGLRHAATPAENWMQPGSWDRRNFYKLFGFFAVVVGVILVLLVNLSAAHYRNLIDLKETGLFTGLGGETMTDALGQLGKATSFPRFLIEESRCEAVLGSPIGTDIGSAATNAMCRPFALHSLDAMVLFALGLAISALAAFEGRGADASFPGLSDAARQFERSREDLRFALEDYYDAIDDLVIEARQIAEGIYDDEDDRPEGFRADERGYSKFTRKDELLLRSMLASRVEFAQRLLATKRDILSDEFAVDMDIVDRITRVRDKRDSDEGAA